MKLICVLCERAVEVGEPLLANQSGELAHQSCVESRSEIRVQLPSVTISSTKVEPSKLDLTTRPAGGVGTVPEPCLLPSAPKVCVVCGKPCIGACPVCRRLVCQDYGYNGPNCAGRHETDCPGAAEQRAPLRKVAEVWKPKAPLFDVEPVRHLNGSARKTKPRKGGRR